MGQTMLSASALMKAPPSRGPLRRTPCSAPFGAEQGFSRFSCFCCAGVQRHRIGGGAGVDDHSPRGGRRDGVFPKASSARFDDRPHGASGLTHDHDGVHPRIDRAGCLAAGPGYAADAFEPNSRWARALFDPVYHGPGGFRGLEQGASPYLEDQLALEDAVERTVAPFRTFMIAQTRESDLMLFADLSGGARFNTVSEVPLTLLIPAFVTSELKTAFQIGFLILIPFLVIDLVVASVLMSMGMVMLSRSLFPCPSSSCCLFWWTGGPSS